MRGAALAHCAAALASGTLQRTALARAGSALQGLAEDAWMSKFYIVLHRQFPKMPFQLLALNHVGVRCTKIVETERFYKETLGLKAHPSKENWLLVNDTYAVHLMPPLADLSEDAAHSVDAARHFALQVADLPSVVATLLDAGERPYQLSLNPAEGRRDVASPQQDLSFGIGTIFCDDPDGNVVEFVDVTKGIFASTNYKLEAA